MDNETAYLARHYPLASNQHRRRVFQVGHLSSPIQYLFAPVCPPINRASKPPAGSHGIKSRSSPGGGSRTGWDGSEGGNTVSQRPASSFQPPASQVVSAVQAGFSIFSRAQTRQNVLSRLDANAALSSWQGLSCRVPGSLVCGLPGCRFSRLQDSTSAPAVRPVSKKVHRAIPSIGMMASLRCACSSGRVVLFRLHVRTKF